MGHLEKLIHVDSLYRHLFNLLFWHVLCLIAALGNVVLCLDYYYNKKVSVGVAIMLQDSYFELLLLEELGRGKVVYYLLLA